MAGVPFRSFCREPPSDTGKGGQAALWALEPLYP